MVTVRRPGRAKSNKRAESHQRSNRGSPTKSSRKEAVILEEDSSEWSEEEPSMVARMLLSPNAYLTCSIQVVTPRLTRTLLASSKSSRPR